MTKTTFLHHFCRRALTFSIQIFEHMALIFKCLYLRHHVDETSLALPYMANREKVYTRLHGLPYMVVPMTF